MRNVTLILKNNKHLELKDCLCVAKFRKNLISISSLNKLDYSFICSSILVNDFFRITPISLLYVVKNNHVSLKRKTPSINQTYLWHLHLGHINLNRIQWLVKFGALHSLVLEGLLVCECYIKGKITKRPFVSKKIRARECLEWVHTDVCEPFNVQAHREYEYFIIFTNN